MSYIYFYRLNFLSETLMQKSILQFTKKATTWMARIDKRIFSLEKKQNT